MSLSPDFCDFLITDKSSLAVTVPELSKSAAKKACFRDNSICARAEKRAAFDIELSISLVSSISVRLNAFGSLFTVILSMLSRILVGIDVATNWTLITIVATILLRVLSIISTILGIQGEAPTAPLRFPLLVSAPGILLVGREEEAAARTA